MITLAVGTILIIFVAFMLGIAWGRVDSPGRRWRK